MKLKIAGLLLAFSIVGFAQTAPAPLTVAQIQQQVELLATKQQLIAEKLRSVQEFQEYISNEKQIQDLYQQYQKLQAAAPAVPGPTVKPAIPTVKK